MPILTTFSLVWTLTYVTDVSIIVQFLVALVGLGVAIDYSLLMIFRFREELHHGERRRGGDRRDDDARRRSVIVSGSTVAIGLLSMILLPLPFIRSIGIGGMLIPAVSVVAAITLVPAMLSLLGHRIDSLRVIPKRIIAADPGETRLLAPLGRLRRAPAAAGRARRPRDRGRAADPGVPDQPGGRAGEGPAGRGRRVRRPRRARPPRASRPA